MIHCYFSNYELKRSSKLLKFSDVLIQIICVHSFNFYSTNEHLHILSRCSFKTSTKNTESEALISPSETQGHHVTSTNTEQLLWTQPTAMWNFLKEIIGGGRAGERLRWRSPEPRGLLFSCKRVSPGRTETASCNCWRSANWEQLKSNTRHVTRRALFSRSAWPADAQHSSKSRETPLF